ncbi:MAG: rod shape-determining protein MreC [Ignavibacteriales bacterium]|nr:rod shape-determining protein MreC [Ignavibacteriaceae bacterium]QOJ29348.1 MAG: rod shape-determining protein MreC [Ignavibacteriales bacterium]
MKFFPAKFFRNFRQYIFLSLLLTASLFLIALSDSPQLMNFRTFTFGLFSVSTEFLKNVMNTTSLRSENMTLKHKNAELLVEVNKLRKAALENEELKRLLGIKDTTTLKLKFSEVVYRVFSSTQGTLVINSGRNDGIERGMPVIAFGGFIGIIHSVDANFSVIRTLKDVNFKVVVKEQGSRYNGILRWNGSSLKVTNLPKTAELTIGDRIVTSPISSLIPVPLTVGTVSKIINPEQGLLSDIEITPSAHLDVVEYVFVLQMKSKNNPFYDPEADLTGNE